MMQRNAFVASTVVDLGAQPLAATGNGNDQFLPPQLLHESRSAAWARSCCEASNAAGTAAHETAGGPSLLADMVHVACNLVCSAELSLTCMHV